MQVGSRLIGGPHEAGLENGARLVSVVAGVLLGATALLHLSAAGDHTNLPVMMAGFLVVATFQAALGAMLVLRRVGRLLAWTGLALTLGALGTWLLSRTAGLPFLRGGHMEPIGFKDGATVLLEVATLPFLALLPNRELDRVSLPSRRLSTHALGLLGSGIFALFLPAFVLGGGEHHSASQLAAGHHGGEQGHRGSDRASTGSGSGKGHEHADGDERGHGGEGDREQGGGSTRAHDDHGSPSGGATQLASADGGAGHGGQGHAGGSSGGEENPDSEGGDRGGHGGGGHAHGRDGSGGGKENRKGHGHGGSKDGGADHDSSAAEPHGEDADHGEHGRDDHGDGPPGDGQRSVALESGGPGRGPALMVYDRPDEKTNGAGHASHGGSPCRPSAEQRAAADELVRQTAAELRKYENNPGRALADGFDYAFGPTDRMLHMVHTRRLRDPEVLRAPAIESFIYYMTDSGFVPIGGMYVMPRSGSKGPQPGGCLTKWHHHGGVVGRWATLGTSDSTPDMMHVFTYPGLDPWGHYSGRELSQLWTPGRWVPSVCRRSGDANDGCLP